MSLRKLPEARSFDRPRNFQWDAPADVLSRWSAQPSAAVEDDNTISMFDVIGEDFFSGGGVTAKRIAGALRAIGNKDVTVKINSPGGDMFEGIAIYNLLRAHPAKVTVEVLGWAASAASIIAMAGDEILMGLGSFVVVHNAWGAVIGNRHDMRAAADLFDGFDGALADIYEARTGLKRADIVALMDGETFMGPSEAVKNGFADGLTEDTAASAAVTDKPMAVAARHRIDALLAQTGLPRSERRRLIREMAGMRDAAGAEATQDAGLNILAIRQLIDTLKS